MVVTRKIQVYVSEQDPEMKKNYIHTLYEWRDNIRKAANVIVAHKYVQQNIRDFMYIKDEIQEKFYVKDILKEGKGMSEQNTTYRVASALLKGKVPSEFYACLNQAVANTFKETLPDMLRGKASVRSYKNNIPMPFAGKTLMNTLHKSEEDGRYYFSLFGIPMAMRFGRDRSNNQLVVDRCIGGEYKACGSSIMIDGNKIFLLLCVDMPKQENKLVAGKKMYAFLGVMNPIVCTTTINAKNEYDSGMKVYEIGNRDEFFYRRRQIQEAIKRCQVNNKYTNGGHGRKQKCKAIERYKAKERNYIDTKTHLYSKMLINLAVKYKCDTIVLMKQKEREENAKEEELILRNWSFNGLKTKIGYKAKMAGIKVIEE